MDVLSSDLAFVQSSLRRALTFQRASLEIVERESGEASSRLASRIKVYLDAIEKQAELVGEAFDSALDDTARLGAINTLRQFVSTVRNLQRTASWLQNADASPLDLGTNYLIEDVASKLIGLETELLIVPDFDGSYATYVDPYEVPPRMASVAGNPASGTVAVVFIPHRETRTGLLHPLIVHELGHAAVRGHGLTSTVMRSALKDQDFIDRVAATASTRAGSTGEDPQSATKVVVDALESWIEESLCDSIASLVLGPTYLLSYAGEVLAEGVDDADQEHPPSWLRVRFMIENLSDWNEIVRGFVPDAMEWLESLANADYPNGDLTVEFLLTTLGDLSGEIHEVAAAHVGALKFTPEEFQAHLELFEELIPLQVPPAQAKDGKPVSRAAIILAFWLYVVRSDGGDARALANAPDAEELARLLPKSMELSAIIEEWEGVAA